MKTAIQNLIQQLKGVVFEKDELARDMSETTAFLPL